MPTDSTTDSKKTKSHHVHLSIVDEGGTAGERLDSFLKGLGALINDVEVTISIMAVTNDILVKGEFTHTTTPEPSVADEVRTELGLSTDPTPPVNPDPEQPAAPEVHDASPSPSDIGDSGAPNPLAELSIEKLLCVKANRMSQTERNRRIRMQRALERAGITNVLQLTGKSADDLLKISNIGNASVDFIEEKLASRSLSLRPS